MQRRHTENVTQSSEEPSNKKAASVKPNHSAHGLTKRQSRPSSPVLLGFSEKSAKVAFSASHFSAWKEKSAASQRTNIRKTRVITKAIHSPDGDKFANMKKMCRQILTHCNALKVLTFHWVDVLMPTQVYKNIGIVAIPCKSGCFVHFRIIQTSSSDI